MDPTNAQMGERIELISFEIGECEYCVDIRSVREIRGWTPATPIPQTPAYIRGVINLRGAVIPIVDLRERLSLGRTEPNSRHVIVVIQDGDNIAGLLVDAVQETFQVDASLMQPPPHLEAVGGDRLVDAVLPLDGRMLSRLVVGALLPKDSMGVAA
jgi:purine-binding chemotaxis protein CheW